MKKFPSRSREAIKLRRQLLEYNSMLQQVREERATQHLEGSDNTDASSDVNRDTIENDSTNETEDDHDPNDRHSITQTGTDNNNTSYPNIR